MNLEYLKSFSYERSKIPIVRFMNKTFLHIININPEFRLIN